MRRLIAAVMAAVVALAWLVAPADASQPIQGIDVSHYQNTVDWSAVPGSISFAATKATENCKTDSQFTRNWQGMRATGRAFRFAYVFLHEGQNPHDVVKCLADAIHKAGGPLQSGEGVALDIEASPTISVDYVLSVATEVQVQLNRFPLLYSGCFYGHIMTAKSLAGYGKWLAEYSAAAKCPYDVWQFSSSGSVAGVGSRVDVNTYNMASAFYALVRSTRDSIADSKSTLATLQPQDQAQVVDLTAFYRAIAFRNLILDTTAHNLLSVPSIVHAQQALNALGAGITVDGKLGPATQRAILFTNAIYGYRDYNVVRWIDRTFLELESRVTR